MEECSGDSVALVRFLAVAVTLCIIPSIATADLTIEKELDAAVSALRSRGYTLFPNAIATSSLRSCLLSCRNSNFTLFSPPDSFLFSLDLSSAAAQYTRSLFRHVAPVRLAALELRALRAGTSITTLLPDHNILVQKTQVYVNDTVVDSVTVDDIPVSVPDLFLGSGIAVHGLNGIIVAASGSTAKDDDSGEFELMPPVVCCQVCDSPASSLKISPTPANGSPRNGTRTRDGRFKRDRMYGHERGRHEQGRDRDRACHGLDNGFGHSRFAKFKRQFTFSTDETGN